MEAQLEEEQDSPEPSWELEVSVGQRGVELELAVPSAAVDMVSWVSPDSLWHYRWERSG